MGKMKATQPAAPLLFAPIIGDGITTALWVLTSSFIGELSTWLDPQLPQLGGEYVISITLLLVLLLIFSPICSLLWGAIFNPVNNLALVVSGKGKLLVNIIRMGAQVGGALAGSHAATQLIPAEYQSKFHYNAGGLKDGILLEHGFACEVLLGLMASLLFLLSIDMQNKRAAFWVPLLATALWCHLGSSFTGPSMNPSIALSWNWHYQKHSLKEHLVVFWLGPFTGAAVAGLVYRWLTRNSTGGAAGSKHTREVAKRKPAAATAQKLQQAAVSKAHYSKANGHASVNHGHADNQGRDDDADGFGGAAPRRDEMPVPSKLAKSAPPRRAGTDPPAGARQRRQEQANGGDGDGAGGKQRSTRRSSQRAG